jgi:hypothetical protein
MKLEKELEMELRGFFLQKVGKDCDWATALIFSLGVSYWPCVFIYLTVKGLVK